MLDSLYAKDCYKQVYGQKRLICFGQDSRECVLNLPLHAKKIDECSKKSYRSSWAKLTHDVHSGRIMLNSDKINKYS